MIAHVGPRKLISLFYVQPLATSKSNAASIPYKYDNTISLFEVKYKEFLSEEENFGNQKR